MFTSLPDIAHIFPESPPATWEANGQIYRSLNYILSVLDRKHNVLVKLGGELEVMLNGSNENIRVSIAKDVRKRCSDIIYNDEDYFDRSYKSALEFRLKPCQVEKFLPHYGELINTIRSSAKEHGMPTESLRFFDLQISTSFWNQYGNIFQSEHRDFNTKGQNIANGMLQAASDNLIFIYQPKHLAYWIQGMKVEQTQPLNYISWGHRRDNLFRFDAVNGRVELRNEYNVQSEHLQLTLLVLLGGALYGLNSGRIKTSGPQLYCSSHVSEELSQTAGVTPSQTYSRLTTLCLKAEAQNCLKHILDEPTLLSRLAEIKRTEVGDLIPQTTLESGQIPDSVSTYSRISGRRRLPA